MSAVATAHEKTAAPHAGERQFSVFEFTQPEIDYYRLGLGIGSPPFRVVMNIYNAESI